MLRKDPLMQIEPGTEISALCIKRPINIYKMLTQEDEKVPFCYCKVPKSVV